MARKPISPWEIFDEARPGGLLPTVPQAVDSYAALVGRRPAHVMWYRPWCDPDSKQYPSFPLALMDAVRAKGSVPMLSWEPNDPAYPMGFAALVAGGKYDAFLKTWAWQARRWGRYFIPRFAWAMTPPYQFYGGVKQRPADVVSMWARAFNLFQSAGAVNCDWFRCPNTDYPGCAPLASVFPGDGCVDLVGLDGYNWGHSGQNHWWTSFKDVFMPSYQALCSLSIRPVVIGEAASAEDGTNRGVWITQTLLTDVLASSPRIAGVTWFNQPKEQQWQVDSSPASLDAFRAVAAHPLSQGGLA